MQFKISEEIIYLNRDIVRKIDEAISANPALTFSEIINQALEEWFSGLRTTNFNRDYFISDAPIGFGPTSEMFFCRRK